MAASVAVESRRVCGRPVVSGGSRTSPSLIVSDPPPAVTFARMDRRYVGEGGHDGNPGSPLGCHLTREECCCCPLEIDRAGTDMASTASSVARSLRMVAYLGRFRRLAIAAPTADRERL